MDLLVPESPPGLPTFSLPHVGLSWEWTDQYRAWADRDMLAQGASACAVLQSSLDTAGSTEADQHLLQLYELKPVTTCA